MTLCKNCEYKREGESLSFANGESLKIVAGPLFSEEIAYETLKNFDANKYMVFRDHPDKLHLSYYIAEKTPNIKLEATVNEEQ